METGTKYVTDLYEREYVDGAPLAPQDHILAAVRRNPGRWVLVGFSIGGRAVRAPGVRMAFRYSAVTENVGGIRYTRTYIRTYAHDGSGVTQDQLNAEARLLPAPTFDMGMDDWVAKITLPRLDMSDGGFCWTQQELDDVTRLAMAALHGGRNLTKLPAWPVRKLSKE
ncbi:hypothetical protein [Glutamicibacter creatinolyticus]|uniref:hypothetical protein n=1 Tax=Glutamicibacter creatinolyticus TaxID=162496 RepID=UPI003216DF8D